MKECCNSPECARAQLIAPILERYAILKSAIVSQLNTFFGSFKEWMNDFEISPNELTFFKLYERYTEQNPP